MEYVLFPAQRKRRTELRKVTAKCSQIGSSGRTLLASMLLAAGIVILSQMTSAQIGPVPANIGFDAVSIRADRSGQPFGSLSMLPEGDGLIARNVSFQRLIEFAFDFRIDELVTGAPDWARSEKVDVVAKVAEADLDVYHKLSTAQQRSMLRKVLEQRCKLVAYTTPREVPTYELVQAKSGPTMRRLGDQDLLPEPPLGPNGEKTHEEPIFIKRGQIQSEGVTLSVLALALSNSHLGRPVVDKTGLTGKYAFSLQWDPDLELGRSSSPTELQSSTNSANEDIFTALRSQLGLRLVPARNVVTGLQIDHLERPSDN